MPAMSELAALQRERLELFEASLTLNTKLQNCRLRLAAALVLSGEPAAANATNSPSAGKCTGIPIVTVVDSFSPVAGWVAEGTCKEKEPFGRFSQQLDSSDFDHTDEETEGAERMQVDLDVMSKLLGSGKGNSSSRRTRASDGAAEEADDDPADLPAQRGRLAQHPSSASSGMRRQRRQSLPPPSTGGLHGAMEETGETAKTRSMRRWAKIRATTMFLRAFQRSRYPWKQLAGERILTIFAMQGMRPGGRFFV